MRVMVKLMMRGVVKQMLREGVMVMVSVNMMATSIYNPLHGFCHVSS